MPSKLVLEREQLYKQLEERIALGKMLLNFKVKTVFVSQMINNPEIKYDQKEYDDFHSEYRKWDKYNIELLRQSFNHADNEYKKEYEDAIYLPGMYGSKDLVNDDKKGIQKKLNVLDSLVGRLPIIQTEMNKIVSSSNNPTEKKMTNKVFIVHGHDVEAKTMAARFVEQLGFEAIILHERVNAGQTIIEKIEANSDVGFGIVLYTPCDLGADKDHKDNLKARARQNVVFEHGYLIGKIGRHRVVALVKGIIDTPGDISGVVYEKMDDAGMWRYSIGKEMQNAGYPVDLNKIK